VKGEFTMDDAVCAGRIVELLDAERTDAAAAAVRLAGSFGSVEEGLRASQSARNLVNADLEEDIVWCARENSIAVLPRLVALRDGIAEIGL
jgi:phosphosulfolactate phosphohydrolase-like enzyme